MTECEIERALFFLIPLQMPYYQEKETNASCEKKRGNRKTEGGKSSSYTKAFTFTLLLSRE